MAGMKENPYQSPKEEDYDPLHPRLDPKHYDKIALWITGLLCYALMLAMTAFVLWLKGG